MPLLSRMSLGLKLLNRGISGQRRVPEVTICYLWDTLVFDQVLTEISRNLSVGPTGLPDKTK